MIVKPRGSVTIPKLPRTVGSILQWCREVNRSIQQLRDRAIVVNAKGSNGGGSCSYFKISQTSTGIQITESTIGGVVPTGFEDGSISFEGESGYVISTLTIDEETGDPVSATITIQEDSTLPPDTSTEFSVIIGGWSTTEGVKTVWNDRCGPINANICRDWFAAVAPYYGVTFL